MKRLYGWEPRQTSTVTEWDEQGRPAKWVTITEPEWDRRERSLMLALHQYEAGLCKRCGQHLSHAMDPNTDPDRPDATQTWKAEGPDECHSCKTLVRAERQLAGEDEGAGGDRLTYSVYAPVLVAKRPRQRRKTR